MTNTLSRRLASIILKATRGLALVGAASLAQADTIYAVRVNALDGAGSNSYCSNYTPASGTCNVANLSGNPGKPTQLVTFDANGGTCATATNAYVIGEPYGWLPEATWAPHKFDGWWAPIDSFTVKVPEEEGVYSIVKDDREPIKVVPKDQSKPYAVLVHGLDIVVGDPLHERNPVALREHRPQGRAGEHGRLGSGQLRHAGPRLGLPLLRRAGADAAGDDDPGQVRPLRRSGGDA